MVSEDSLRQFFHTHNFSMQNFTAVPLPLCQFCARGTVLTCSYFSERTSTTKTIHHLKERCSWDQDHQIDTGNVVISALLLYSILKKTGGPSALSSADWLIRQSELLGYGIKRQIENRFMELSLLMAFLLSMKGTSTQTGVPGQEGSIFKMQMKIKTIFSPSGTWGNWLELLSAKSGNMRRGLTKY